MKNNLEIKFSWVERYSAWAWEIRSLVPDGTKVERGMKEDYSEALAELTEHLNQIKGASSGN